MYYEKIAIEQSKIFSRWNTTSTFTFYDTLAAPFILSFFFYVHWVSLCRLNVLRPICIFATPTCIQITHFRFCKHVHNFPFSCLDEEIHSALLQSQRLQSFSARVSHNVFHVFYRWIFCDFSLFSLSPSRFVLSRDRKAVYF